MFQLDDPVYDASIGIEHHSQVAIGPPSHDQQAATDVADDVWLNMPVSSMPAGQCS